MNVTLVYNSKSGKAFSAEELRARFKKHDITIDRTMPFSDEIKAKLQAHSKRGGIIAVVGGDGTMSSVANVIAGNKAAMMPLPGGTLNHFTKDLGISQDIDEALSQAAKSKPKRIDVARVNGKVFLNNSSIGLYPFAVHVRSHFEDVLGKWPAAFIGSLRALLRYRLYTVTIDAETIKTPFIFVGNNDYHLESLESVGRQKLTGGVLSVYVLKTQSAWQLARVLVRFVFGRLKSSPDARLWRTKRVAIQTKGKNIRVTRDGEVEKLTTPLEYVIEPESLLVIGSS